MRKLYRQQVLSVLFVLAALLSRTQAQDVDPTIIQTCETETAPITVTLPASTEAEPVDVMFLFDDTGTFARASSQLANQFGALVTQLEAAFPSVDFGYGVAKYEDFGGVGTDYGGQFADSRPAILNQPIVTAAELGGSVDALNTLIIDALRRTAPENGGDIPESAIEGLYYVATGAGFDGNGDGTFLGLDGTQIAGANATQTAPDQSGDVPDIGSLDPAILTAGTVGGGLFRSGSKKLLILATDACTVAPFIGEIPATVSSEFSTEPSEDFSCGGGVRYGQVGDALVKADSTIARSIAPLGAHTVPDTVAALVANGIKVMGLSADAGATASGSGPSDSPSVFLSALARLTGAVDANGDALVTQIDVNDATAIQAAILNAISTFVAPPLNVQVSPQGCDTIAGLTLAFDPPTAENVFAGSNVTFDVSFDIDPALASGTCQLQFVDGSGTLLATDAIQLEVCQSSIIPSVSPSTGSTSVSPTTQVASGAPSVAPSAAPIVGTVAPSIPASLAPSILGASAAPSGLPSILPTAFPSAARSEGSPTQIPSIAPTILPTAALSEGSPTKVPSISPTRAPTALPSLGAGNTRSPTAPPSTGPPSTTSPPTALLITSPSPASVPVPVPQQKGRQRTSLFGRLTGANFFSTIKTGEGKVGGPGSIRFDFTHPIPKGEVVDDNCWGFNCPNGGGSRAGGNAKGSKAVKGSKGGKGGSQGQGAFNGGGNGGFSTGSKNSTPQRGGKGGSKGIVSTVSSNSKSQGKGGGKGGSSKVKGSGKGGGKGFSHYNNDYGNEGISGVFTISKGDAQVDNIFESIFDNEITSASKGSKAGINQELRSEQKRIRRERIRNHQMVGTTTSTRPVASPGGGNNGGDTTQELPGQFVLVTDTRDDPPPENLSDIVFISTQLMQNGGDRVRRRAAAVENVEQ
ncbi:hypothetical protein MPSEU_000243100 [Mayamaea pseudoterrestris]|nr:hypothetical protein MPSEU_000243100 [Mayamaea pseudoterrestris]